MVILNMFGLVWQGKVTVRRDSTVCTDPPSDVNRFTSPMNPLQVVLFSAIGVVLCVLIYGMVTATPVMKRVTRLVGPHFCLLRLGWKPGPA